MIKPSWAGCAACAALLLGCASGHEKEVQSAPPHQSEGRVAQESAVETTGSRVGAEVGEAPRQSLDDLVGVEWRWSRFNDPVAGGLNVSNPEDYTLVLMDDGSVVVESDCNTGTGVYSVDGSNLTVRITKVTSDTCGENSLTTEFVDDLNSSSRFFLQDGNLFVDLRYDSGTMKFTRGEPADALE
jgi:heat shock protein HslJ